MSTSDDNTGREAPPPALARAEAGAQAWHDAVLHQRAAEPDHADIYALTGEIVPTLSTLQDLANVLRAQVAGYGVHQGIYDDSRTVDPAVRLAEAAEYLALMRDALAAAYLHANAFWSAISHIGIEAQP